MAACRSTILEQLRVSIKQAWSSITPADWQRLVSLVESMPRRVQAVIAAKEVLLSTEDFPKLLKVHVHGFVLFYSTV